MPITSPGPKVPTARMSSPMYEAPVPVTYWCDTDRALHQREHHERTRRQHPEVPGSRISSSTAAGTSTKICR